MIPAYNAEKYIKEAIDSALNQTYKDIEILVCDDVSTDRTYKILEKYGDKIKLLRHDWNAGPAFTLNSCIKQAKGEWIKWLSADDVLYPESIDMLMEHATDHKTIYYTHYTIIDKFGNYIKRFTEPERVESDLWKLFYGNGSSSIIHRDVFELCGLFDENLRHSEDYEFWLRATQLYGVRLRLIPEYTLKYRRHPDQLTNKVGGTLDAQIKDSIRQRLSTLKH